MSSIYGKSARWVLSIVLAGTMSAAYSVVAVAATTGSNNSGCSSSTGSSDQGCSFSSSGLQSTFVSGAGTYGALFSNGFGGGGGPPGSNPGATSSLTSSRFALGGGDTGKAAAGAGSNWNAWFALSHSDVGYKFQPLQSSGHVDVTLFGADYTFANNATVGVAAGWDRSRVGTSFNGGNINSDGNIVSPYVSWRFSPAWSLRWQRRLG